MAVVYQIAQDVNGTQEQKVLAWQTLGDLAVTCTAPRYGLTILDVSLDGSGRLRLRVSNPLPQEEVDSFAGAFFEV
jgi:hypothetical protein